MPAVERNIVLEQYSDFQLKVTLKAAGVAVNLTGESAKAQIRYGNGQLLTNLVCVVEPEGAQGVVTVSLSGVEIAKLPVVSSGLRWDLLVGTSRIFEGYAQVSKGVSKP